MGSTLVHQALESSHFISALEKSGARWNPIARSSWMRGVWLVVSCYFWMWSRIQGSSPFLSLWYKKTAWGRSQGQCSTLCLSCVDFIIAGPQDGSWDLDHDFCFRQRGSMNRTQARLRDGMDAMYHIDFQVSYFRASVTWFCYACTIMYTHVRYADLRPKGLI